MITAFDVPHQKKQVRQYSSQKVQNLYQEFQSLKTRMTSSTKRRNQSTELNQSLMEKQALRNTKLKEKSFLNDSGIEYTSYMGNNEIVQGKVKEQGVSNENNSYQKGKEMFQFKYSFQKIIDNFTKVKISKFQKDVTDRIVRIQRKSKISEEFLKNVKKMIGLKRQFEKNCKKESSDSKIYLNEEAQIKQMKKKYEDKIYELTQQYEQKLKSCCEQEKDRETFSSTIDHSKKQQNNFYEKEIISKENELSKIKLDHHKLKRTYQSLKNKYENSLNSLSEFQEYKLKEMSRKNMMSKEMYKKNEEIDRLNKQLEEMREALNTKDEEITKYRNGQVEKERIHSKENNIVLRELDEDRNDKSEQLDISIQQQNEKASQMHKSMILEPIKFVSKHSIKDLEVEINLMEEQNKYLKSKKNYFATQIRNAEQDEERFQMQSALMKEELKRFNKIMRDLQQILKEFLNKGSFQITLINALPNQVKLKKILTDIFEKMDQKKKKN